MARQFMSPTRADLKFSYEEYRELPETGPRYQLIDGELLMSPAPNSRHGTIVARIFFALYSFVASGKLGIVRVAPQDVLLSPMDVVQPDVFFVSKERSHILSPEGFRGAPDLCVEVLSDGTRGVDLGPKRILYARHGVLEYWVADPEAGTIDVYRFQEDAAAPVKRLAAADTLASPLLSGLTVSLSEVFAPEPRP